MLWNFMFNVFLIFFQMLLYVTDMLSSLIMKDIFFYGFQKIWYSHSFEVR